MASIPRLFSFGQVVQMAFRGRQFMAYCLKCQRKLKFPRLNLAQKMFVTGMATPAIGKAFADNPSPVSEGSLLISATRAQQIHLKSHFTSLITSLEKGGKTAETCCSKVSQDMSIIKEADKLLESDQFTHAYKLLYQYRDSNNEEILWRLAKSIHELSKEKQNSTERKEMSAEAFFYISRAMEINSRHGEIHKWMAILMDAYYKEMGVKARLAHVVQVKKHMIAAADIDPKDPLPWYMLGWWCYSLADLPWAHRQISKLIYGDLPEATFEEAQKYFEKAESVKTNYRGMNFVMLGKTYLKLEQKEKAIVYFRKALQYEVSTIEDQQAKAEAKSFLTKLGINFS